MGAAHLGHSGSNLSHCLSAGAAVISRLDWGWNPRPGSPMVSGRPQFFTGCWLEASISPHRGLSIGCLSVLLMWPLASLTLSDPRHRERVQPRGKPQSFYCPILRVTYHHSCSILFIRSRSLSPSHPQKKKIIHRHEHHQTRIMKAILKAGYPRTPNSQIFADSHKIKIIVFVSFV